MSGTPAAGSVVLIVDVANVMGSRPDGWWRDRAGAAARLLDEFAALPGRTVPAPDEPGRALRIGGLVAVVEGAARRITDPELPGLHLVRAERDGDTAIVAEAERRTGDPAGAAVVVVTADRGLRSRLPAGAVAAGPGWLLGVLGEPGRR